MKTRSSSSRRRNVLAEPLERRTLLSASWSTTNTDFSYPYVYYNSISGLSSDRTGNLYRSAYVDLGGSPEVDADVVQEKPHDSASWTTIYTDPNTEASGSGQLATDAGGNVFFGGMSITYTPTGAQKSDWIIREHRPGQDGFSIIDDLPGGACASLTTDAAGDIFAVGHATFTTTVMNKGKVVGTTTSQYNIVRELAPGPSGYTATTLYQSTLGQFKRVLAVDSGPAAGLYVVGTTNNNWAVWKGTNGGKTWAQTDNFDYDTTTGSVNWPSDVVADFSGNLYVSGSVQKYTITGYTTQTVHGKTTQVPVYNNVPRWLVRKSTDGGVSWTTDDDFQPNPVNGASAAALGVDLAGNVYAAGSAFAGSHAIIRTNTGGSWTTSDDYTGDPQDGHPDAGRHPHYSAITTDPDGNLYVGGVEGALDDVNLFIRSAPNPAAAGNGTTTTPMSAAFSSTPITASTLLDTSASDDDSLQSLLA